MDDFLSSMFPDPVAFYDMLDKETNDALDYKAADYIYECFMDMGNLEISIYDILRLFPDDYHGPPRAMFERMLDDLENAKKFMKRVNHAAGNVDPNDPNYEGEDE